jgi:hypothetical protein
LALPALHIKVSMRAGILERKVVSDCMTETRADKPITLHFQNVNCIVVFQVHPHVQRVLK